MSRKRYTIKPLKWETYPEHYTANTPFGDFRVWVHTRTSRKLGLEVWFTVGLPPGMQGGGAVASIKDGKELCQEKYEEVLKKCLNPVLF